MLRSSANARYVAFAAVTVVCIATAVRFVIGRIPRQRPPAHTRSVAIDSPADRAALMKAAHALVLEPYQSWSDREARFIGVVSLVALDPKNSRRIHTSLECDRLHFAAGTGICLLRNTSAGAMGESVDVTLFDSTFESTHTFNVEGFPTRARVSPDGRYAAFTVFVTGHSYADANMSTATTLLDIANGQPIANLEDFTILRDGARYQSPDVNYWGVTFTADSSNFYTTLRTRGVNYLARGNISGRTVTVMRPDVECPSLSPDGTRLVFKRSVPGRKWRLTSLDLLTMQETPLAEIQSVDDQVEWLDAEHVLYESVAPDSANRWPSIMMVPADGTGEPAVFASKATSPAVVRSSGAQAHN
jgi:hypothetical protein